MRRPLVVVGSLLLLAGGGYAAFGLGDGAPREEDAQVAAAHEPLTAFLAAWAGQDARKAASYTDTPDDAASLLTSVLTNLKPSKTTIVGGQGLKKGEGHVRFPFTVTMTVPGAGEVTWRSGAQVSETSGTWKVEFAAPMIHPELKPGQTLALKSGNTRADVLDAKGDPLRADSLVGTVDPVSGKGTSGLEARYDAVLSGGSRAAKSLVVADRQSGQA
ncbi:NTF2-like N-terminal transpeptidase domain-containing protein, partial [Streptomyces sp. H39-S7]|uniref:NTF2-like N-terminal transpeptidase domain-containing protein n=1 Tax=Streptomyces sp. H39-S7 TaxID=3004357 RepID=UPI002F3567D1